MVGARRGEDRSRTGEYGGTVRAPSTLARAARSALAVGTLVNSPGYFDGDEALTLGRAVAGLNAYAKGVRLGVFAPSPPKAVAERRKKLTHGEKL
jgi:hypothetical protein